MSMITFDAIRDIERTERENKKLQKIPENFFDLVRDYLDKKEKMKEKSSLDLLEIENTKNTIKRLMDIREKKIMELAIMTSRTGIPPENLTCYEKELFQQILDNLNAFRCRVSEQMNKILKEIVYKVKKSIPDFVGPDMKIYNLRENDIVSLPKNLADMLVKENILEEMRSD